MCIICTCFLAIWSSSKGDGITKHSLAYSFYKKNSSLKPTKFYHWILQAKITIEDSSNQKNFTKYVQY